MSQTSRRTSIPRWQVTHYQAGNEWDRPLEGPCRHTIEGVIATMDDLALKVDEVLSDYDMRSGQQPAGVWKKCVKPAQPHARHGRVMDTPMLFIVLMAFVVGVGLGGWSTEQRMGRESWRHAHGVSRQTLYRG